MTRLDLSIDVALSEQVRLARAVIRTDALGPVRRVAGVDVAYAKDGARMICAAASLDPDTLAPIEIATVSGEATFPYIPGLFSFRELPIVLEALDRLSVSPDLIICDGQGIAHPRRFGLASHLGVVRDVPTIGCAKTRLIGTYVTPGNTRGSVADLIDEGEVIGAALRTQTDIKPVYVSIGHRVSLATACDWVLRLSPRYRLPETTRVADHAVKLLMKESAP